MTTKEKISIVAAHFDADIIRIIEDSISSVRFSLKFDNERLFNGANQEHFYKLTVLNINFEKRIVSFFVNLNYLDLIILNLIKMEEIND